MDNYIRKELDKRFHELKQEKLTNGGSTDSKTAKSVISLATESYIQENKQLMQKLELDEQFARYVTYQIWLFLFAGNDTTSSTIVYVFHLLSRHP